MIKWYGVLTAMAVVGCTSTVTRQEMVGVFVANLPKDNDTLNVHDDGTYMHSYSSGGTSPTVQSGRWTIEPGGSGETRVTFDDFVMTIGPNKSPRPAFWPASAEKRFGKVRLIINDDMNLYYSKK